ncbi:hypothetical protein GCM10010172_39680 [Paractinoplanes ferrugineus]|uniref:AB hydrolase-1 domain-containing protein n=1 Tax=Paractinoplanes ferrugineus TaxID=113564 RepID=A0A919J1I3_9ACTN|nr:alpha/beta fold hydrolase [Actinoplanes ferrugineus]GIE12745.1 hypothetical protein Afe05nite_45850 [Actinoplanes ferrugineus]
MTVAAREEIRELTYQGLRYTCRISWCENPDIDPILVLCGAYQDVYTWRRFDKYWNHVATTISLDLPGSHTTDPVPADEGYDVHAGALGHALDELGLERVNLVAISYGFGPAHLFAQKSPERISNLVLSGAAADFPPDVRRTMVDGMQFLESGNVMEWARGTVGLFMCQDPEVTVRNRELLHRALMAKFTNVPIEELPRYLNLSRRAVEHLPTRPGGISGVRTLCLTGEHDTIAVPDDARALAAEIDGALFTTIRETDHLAFQERGADWAETLRRFFSGESLQGLDFLTPIEQPSRALAVDASL